jgi:hypothetical protein
VTATTVAIYHVLTADPELVGMVNVYDGMPAIFASRPLPSDVKAPFIIVDGETETGDGDALNSAQHRSRLVDIRFYWPSSGSWAPLGLAGDRVHDLLHHRIGLALADGWTVKRAVVTALQEIPADEERYPALMSVRVDVTRKGSGL